MWCQRQCLRYPSTCPKEDCKCYNKTEEEKLAAAQKPTEGGDDNDVADIVETAYVGYIG